MYNASQIFTHSAIFPGCVYFIDHEYAMFNYEHFELGNHFCEYAGKLLFNIERWKL